MKDKSSPTSPPHGLHGAGIPASPHGRFIKPASTTSRPASAGPHYCFFKLVSITPTYFDISAGPGASPSLHQPTPNTSALLAVGDIPRGINRRMYDPARVWRFTGNPLGHGGLRFIGNPAGGSEERQDPVARLAAHEGRFDYGGPV